MDTRTLINLLRKLEAEHDYYTRDIPIYNTCFPDLFSFALLAVCVAQPTVGLLFCMSEILNQLSNNTIPSIPVRIRESYHNGLVDSRLNEEKIDQENMLSPANELCLLFKSGLGKKYDDSGKCHGLMKLWYLFLIEDFETDFFENFRAISLNVQSYFSHALTLKQQKFIEAIDIMHDRSDGEPTTVEIIDIHGNSVLLHIEKITRRLEESIIEFVDFDAKIYPLLNKIVNYSRDNPDRLVNLGLQIADAAHSIGLSTHYKHGVPYIHCFDSNFKRTRFRADIPDDVKAGIESLADLLRYKYQFFFENLAKTSGCKRGNVSLTYFRGQHLTLEKNQDLVEEYQEYKNSSSLC